jgi:malate synthase
MATGEIRLSILWEWIHKGAVLTEDDLQTEIKSGDVFTMDLYEKLMEEEYKKLLQADNKDVYNASKNTTLPIAREIANVYIHSEIKPPWYIDLLNINLNTMDLAEAKKRIDLYMNTLTKEGRRITENLDFVTSGEAIKSL